jgi:antitoxin (DNA-binding transcriptional repressor) of toxin-antitoxin stability system
MGLDNLKENVLSAIDTLKDGISANPLGAVAGATGVGVVLGGSAVAGVVAAKKRKKKKSRSKRSRKKSSRSRSRRRRKGRRTPRTAGKRKDRSTKRIRYTKRGQPYVITRSGKAKFISKRGAKASRKRKGGRY